MWSFLLFCPLVTYFVVNILFSDSEIEAVMCCRIFLWICVQNNIYFLFVLAYNHNTGETTLQAKLWYCEVCNKQLNGPKPYQAHIVSRAHKDELEAQGHS